MREWGKPGALAEKNRADVRTRLADLAAEMDEASPAAGGGASAVSASPEAVAELLAGARRGEDAAKVQAARLQKELSELRLGQEECRAQLSLLQ
jgi:formiminotetrahydrofolate cyclodeaminase